MKHLLILAMTLLAVSSYGQSELPTGRIEVVKDFEVRLTETKKIRIVPQPWTFLRTGYAVGAGGTNIRTFEQGFGGVF